MSDGHDADGPADTANPADAAGAATAIAEARELIAVAVARLTAAHARDEALAEYVAPHVRMLIPRAATMRPIERVWRLGVLLLGRSGALYATGSLIRAQDVGRRSQPSRVAEERTHLREAAMRGRFAAGETVDFDAVPIPLDAEALTAGIGPVALRDGRLLVSWNGSRDPSAWSDLSRYLDERVELLVHPPEGA